MKKLTEIDKEVTQISFDISDLVNYYMTSPFVNHKTAIKQKIQDEQKKIQKAIDAFASIKTKDTKEVIRQIIY